MSQLPEHCPSPYPEDEPVVQDDPRVEPEEDQ
jgi:hypothetical protein